MPADSTADCDNCGPADGAAFGAAHWKHRGRWCNCSRQIRKTPSVVAGITESRPMIAVPKSGGLDMCGRDLRTAMDRTGTSSAFGQDHTGTWYPGDEADLTACRPAQVPGHSDGGNSRVQCGKDRT